MGSRKLLFEGSLKKSRSGRELVAFLFNDMLLLTRPEKDAPPTGDTRSAFSFDDAIWRSQRLVAYRQAWRLDRIRVEAAKSKRVCTQQQGVDFWSKEALSAEFIVHTAGGSGAAAGDSIKLKASSRIECQQWVNKLQEAIKNYLSVIERSSFRDPPVFGTGQIECRCVEWGLGMWVSGWVVFRRFWKIRRRFYWLMLSSDNEGSLYFILANYGMSRI